MSSKAERGNGHDRSGTRNHRGGRRRWALGIAVCLAVVALGSVTLDEARSTAAVDSGRRAEILNDYAKLPIRFTRNQGQYPEEVKYYFDSPGGRVYFTSDGVVMQFVEPLTDPALPHREEERAMERRPVPGGGEADREETASRGYVIRKQFVDANPHCRVEGSSALPGTVNIFRGSDPSQWKTGIPTYKELTYHDLYPGIDLVYKGVDGRLKYDLIVNPGADLSRVRSLYAGVDRVEVTGSGALTMSVTPDKENGPRPLHEERAPVIYQEIDGETVFVDGKYHVQEDGSIGFQLSGYDASFPVVIDPRPTWSTPPTLGAERPRIVGRPSRSTNGAMSMLVAQPTHPISPQLRALLIPRTMEGPMVL
jgi:hypothetical protein